MSGMCAGVASVCSEVNTSAFKMMIAEKCVVVLAVTVTRHTLPQSTPSIPVAPPCATIKTHVYIYLLIAARRLRIYSLSTIIDDAPPPPLQIAAAPTALLVRMRL